MDQREFMDSYQRIFGLIINMAPGFDKKEGLARLVNYELSKKVISLDLAKLISEINNVRNNVINPPPTGYQIPLETNEKIQKIFNLLNTK